MNNNAMVKNMTSLLRAFALTFLPVVAVVNAQPQLRWATIDRGGGKSSTGGVNLLSSVGNPGVASTGEASQSLESGFIPGLRNLAGFSTTLSQPVSGGWNLMSVPLVVKDFRTIALYPGAASPAFIYRGSYTQRDTLSAGSGFWMKFGAGGSVPLTGTAAQTESVAVLAGWNIIGPPGYPVLTSAIVPSGTTVLSNYFGYSNSYFIEDTLKPGHGYWVKVSSPGILVLSAGAVANEPLASQLGTPVGSGHKKFPSGILPSEEVDVLRITGASKETAALYFTTSSIDPAIKPLELPPRAPEGSIDVRFGTNRLIEFADSRQPRRIPINVGGMGYPLILEWELSQGLGRTSCSASLVIDGHVTQISGSGRIQASESKSGEGNRAPEIELLLSPAMESTLPREFAVSQNYHNPFNPSTVIRYQLPVASVVSLRVYNLLGEEVAALADDRFEQAGFREVRWDAGNLPTGVYFYRLKATSASDPSRTYSEAKKMLLTK
jgi:hypothetical protein